jgi:hypothetical protein
MALDLKNPGNREIAVFGGGALLLALIYFALSKKTTATGTTPATGIGTGTGTAADNQTFLPGGASPTGNAFTDALFSTPATASPGAASAAPLPSVVHGAVHSTSQGASAVLPASPGGGSGFPSPSPGGGGGGAFGAFNSSGAPTPLSWATSLLKAGGFPQTAANLQSLIAWALNEGGGGAANPLNTTQSAAGATTFNSVGVKNYPSWATGIGATIQTINNGRYPNIVADLKSGKGIGGNAGSDLLTWSGSGYSAIAGNWARAAAYLAKPKITTTAKVTAKPKALGLGAAAGAAARAGRNAALVKAVEAISKLFRAPKPRPKPKPPTTGGHGAGHPILR